VKKLLAVVMLGSAAIIGVGIGIAVLLGAGVGTTPDWIAALSTLAAFIVAGVAVQYANRAHELEQDRETARLAAETSAQADRFAGWLTSDEVTVGYTMEGPRFHPIGERVMPSVALRNASDMPVYEVKIQVIVDGSTIYADNVREVPPSDRPTMHNYWPKGDESTKGAALILEFTDAAGRRWRRRPGMPPALLSDPTRAET